MRRRLLGQIAAFVAAFAVLGWLGLALSPAGSPVVDYSPFIGLAAGVAARASGGRRLLYVAASGVATVLVRTVLLGSTAPVALAFGAANSAEVLLFAVLLHGGLHAGQLATVADTVRFLSAALLTALGGAVLATPALGAVTGPTVSLNQVLAIYLLSHFVALVVVASVVVAWPGMRGHWTRRMVGDLAVWVALLAATTHLGFRGGVASIAFPYMPLAVVLFATVRLGAPAAAVLLQVLVPAALWYSLHGYGPFADMARGPVAKVAAAQLFCLTAAAMCWLVAARQSERRSGVERLAAANAELESANAQLGKANTELEHRVSARTAALKRAADASALAAHMAQALSEARLDRVGTLRSVAQSLCALADVCVVTRIMPDRRAVEPVAVAAVTGDLARAAEEVWFPLRFDAETKGLTGRALATGQVVRAGGSPQILSSLSHPALPPLLLRFGLHGALVAPMHADAMVVGTLVLLRGESWRPFDDDDEQLVQDLANRAGLAVANAMLHEELAGRALSDPLTGLANRHLLMEQLGLAVRRVERHPGTVAVIFADLDDFKAVNDGLGHEAGDRMLIHVAKRLRTVLRATDTAARLGGDEFVVVCPDLADDAAARSIAERLAEAISCPLPLNGRTVRPRASLGVAVTASAASDPEELLRQADTAMYESKRRGRADVQVYGEQLVSSERDRLDTQGMLHDALVEGWLRLLYQPIVDVQTGSVAAVEALLRLDHPQQGRLTPAAFIDVAESTDVIIELEEWVLQEACTRLPLWQKRRPVELSVNVSGRHISLPGAADRILAVMARSQLTPDNLCIEITERVVIDAQAPVLDNLSTLRRAGVRIALDDFGTGHSPLTYLQTLPIDTLKIDRSFIARLGTAARGHEIVSAITALGKALTLRMIAEGVETPVQLEHLRDLQCDLAQGYYLHRPTDFEVMADLLRRGTTLPTDAATGRPDMLDHHSPHARNEGA